MSPAKKAYSRSVLHFSVQGLGFYSRSVFQCCVQDLGFYVSCRDIWQFRQPCLSAGQSGVDLDVGSMLEP